MQLNRGLFAALLALPFVLGAPAAQDERSTELTAGENLVERSTLATQLLRARGGEEAEASKSAGGDTGAEASEPAGGDEPAPPASNTLLEAENEYKVYKAAKGTTLFVNTKVLASLTRLVNDDKIAIIAAFDPDGQKLMTYFRPTKKKEAKLTQTLKEFGEVLDKNKGMQVHLVRPTSFGTTMQSDGWNKIVSPWWTKEITSDAWRKAELKKNYKGDSVVLTDDGILMGQPVSSKGKPRLPKKAAA